MQLSGPCSTTMPNVSTGFEVFALLLRGTRLCIYMLECEMKLGVDGFTPKKICTQPFDRSGSLSREIVISARFSFVLLFTVS